MIGQKDLINTIEERINNDTFPRFTILVGAEGSGKKVIAQYMADKLNITLVNYGVGVDDIRSMISEAYKNAMPIMYLIADADKMSPSAKNALLKVTEEPPRNAYFILTLTDLNNTLDTIKSRGSVLYVDPYTPDEIDEYYQYYYSANADERRIVSELCSTPGEVDKLMEMGVVDFYEYVKKVVDNVALVSGSNSFKIASQIKMKDTDTDKYDLKLFWKAFMFICMSRLRENPVDYANGIKITSKYLQELRVTGINKASTFDMWLLDIRQAWM